MAFSELARSKNFDASCFDPLRVNDDRPLAALNSRAYCVSYASVLHSTKFALNLSANKAVGPKLGPFSYRTGLPVLIL